MIRDQQIFGNQDIRIGDTVEENEAHRWQQ
jgi:hypothetical protein